MYSKFAQFINEKWLPWRFI